MPFALASGWISLGLFGAAYMFGYVADPMPPKREVARIESNISSRQMDRFEIEMNALTARINALESTLGSVTAALPEDQAAPRTIGGGEKVEIALGPLPESGFGDQDIAFSALPIADGGATKSAFAVAIAVASKREALRASWRKLLAEHKGALDGLEPRLIHEISQTGARRWKLVAGPFANAADAARACAKLKAEKRACVPSVFAGEAL